MRDICTDNPVTITGSFSFHRVPGVPRALPRHCHSRGMLPTTSRATRFLFLTWCCFRSRFQFNQTESWSIVIYPLRCTRDMFCFESRTVPNNRYEPDTVSSQSTSRQCQMTYGVLPLTGNPTSHCHHESCDPAFHWGCAPLDPPCLVTTHVIYSSMNMWVSRVTSSRVWLFTTHGRSSLWTRCLRHQSAESYYRSLRRNQSPPVTNCNKNML